MQSDQLTLNLVSLFEPVKCRCPDKWATLPVESGQPKCIKYFDHPVNFSEAQYICNEIYSGDLVSINSLAEQKALLQYLHNEIGFKRSPVCWLGGRILSAQDQRIHGAPLKWLDGSEPKFSNFGDDFDAEGESKTRGKHRSHRRLSAVASCSLD